jgi:S1-C subfamily serine protease
MSSRRFVDYASLPAAAFGGAAAAIGGAALLFGIGNGGTTIVREVVTAPPGASPAAFSRTDHLSINAIYRAAAPGVVQVTTTKEVAQPSDPFGTVFGFPEQPRTQTERALGSGFVIDKVGHVITNYHVVEGATDVFVSFSDNESMRARVIGKDESTDLAVLQVDARSRALAPLQFADSDGVQVGDAVVAIGNPFGLDRSVTSGIVSALQRPITAPNGFTIDHVIQTDAALNHGNSGGPLLDTDGRVIGVNSQISTGDTGDEGNVGIGFAIPSNMVKDVAAQIIASGKVEHAFLGIRTKAVTPDVARVFRLASDHGLLVSLVEPDSGAATSGLEAGTTQVIVAGETYVLGGDLLVAADAHPLRTTDDLRDVLAGKKPGDDVTLTLYRATKKRQVTIKLGRQPTSPQG